MNTTRLTTKTDQNTLQFAVIKEDRAYASSHFPLTDGVKDIYKGYRRRNG